MNETKYRVPDMSCSHCESAVGAAVAGVDGVDAVDVDLDTKVVTVRGSNVDAAAVRAAIEDAGYEAA